MGTSRLDGHIHVARVHGANGGQCRADISPFSHAVSYAYEQPRHRIDGGRPAITDASATMWLVSGSHLPHSLCAAAAAAACILCLFARISLALGISCVCLCVCSTVARSRCDETDNQYFSEFSLCFYLFSISFWSNMVTNSTRSGSIPVIASCLYSTVCVRYNRVIFDHT